MNIKKFQSINAGFVVYNMYVTSKPMMPKNIPSDTPLKYVPISIIEPAAHNITAKLCLVFIIDMIKLIITNMTDTATSIPNVNIASDSEAIYS